MSIYHKIIIKPLINEKSLNLVSKENKYSFYVRPDVNKKEIKEAIEKLFNVNVIKVNVINIKGKKKNFRRIEGKLNDRKKAIVELKEGQSIEAFNSLK